MNSIKIKLWKKKKNAALQDGHNKSPAHWSVSQCQGGLKISGALKEAIRHFSDRLYADSDSSSGAATSPRPLGGQTVTGTRNKPTVWENMFATEPRASYTPIKVQTPGLKELNSGQGSPQEPRSALIHPGLLLYKSATLVSVLLLMMFLVFFN